MLHLVQPEPSDKPLLVLTRELSASAAALARAHAVLEFIDDTEREAMRQALLMAASQLARVTMIATGLLTVEAGGATPDQAS